jgi:hypothetical protein
VVFFSPIFGLYYYRLGVIWSLYRFFDRRLVICVYWFTLVSEHAYKILITEWTKSNVNKQLFVHTFGNKSAPRRAKKAVTK